MKIPVSTEELSAILESLLAAPPSQAGKRLCSERDLSARFGVDRMKVQKSFDLLVTKGILLRRHGSGTYVRKVPRASTPTEQIFIGDHSISSAELFANDSTKPARRQIQHEHRKLQLAILPNTQWKSESNLNIFEGIKDRIRAGGHQAKILSSKGDLDPKSDRKLIEKLRMSHYDGYVLWSSYATLVNEAFHEHRPPVVFIGAKERVADLDCAPLVRIDLEDATVRGLRQLHKEGHQRIGFIGFKSIEREWRGDLELYNETLDKLALPYRAAEFCQLEDKQTAQVIKKMFSEKNRPEAVYVADDIVLRHILPVWQSMGITPGKDLAVITLSSVGNPLPSGFQWSCMEFNPYQVGRMAVDSLIQEIETAGEVICSFEHLAVWRPKGTHHRTE